MAKSQWEVQGSDKSWFVIPMMPLLCLKMSLLKWQLDVVELKDEKGNTIHPRYDYESNTWLQKYLKHLVLLKKEHTSAMWCELTLPSPQRMSFNDANLGPSDKTMTHDMLVNSPFHVGFTNP